MIESVDKMGVLSLKLDDVVVQIDSNIGIPESAEKYYNKGKKAKRKINGVSIQKFKNKFGENPIFLFKNELSKLVEQNLLIIDGDCIKLTNKGLDLANLVWEEFI